MKAAIILVILHFIGDFFFQNDTMAINKSKSAGWLTIHVLIYTLILFIGALSFIDFCDFDALIGFALINFFLHWVTDFFTSRLTSYLYMRGEKDPKEMFLLNSWRHWFFTAIGFDQVIHYTCLFLTYQHFFVR